MSKATARPPENETKMDEDDGESSPISEIVRSKVIAALGLPPTLFEVAVRVLWDNHYRVNVLVGPDTTSVRIVHSYFVKIGVKGDILSSTPKITRLYE